MKWNETSEIERLYSFQKEHMRYEALCQAMKKKPKDIILRSGYLRYD